MDAEVPPEKCPLGLKDPLQGVIVEVKKDISQKRLKVSSGGIKSSEAVVRNERKRDLDTVMNAEEVDNSSSARVKLTLAEKLEYKKKLNENFDKSLLEVHDVEEESSIIEGNAKEDNIDSQEEVGKKRNQDKEVMKKIFQYVIDIGTRCMDLYCFYSQSVLPADPFVVMLGFLNEKSLFNGFSSYKTIFRVRDWYTNLEKNDGRFDNICMIHSFDKRDYAKIFAMNARTLNYVAAMHAGVNSIKSSLDSSLKSKLLLLEDLEKPNDEALLDEYQEIEFYSELPEEEQEGKK